MSASAQSQWKETENQRYPIKDAISCPKLYPSGCERPKVLEKIYIAKKRLDPSACSPVLLPFELDRKLIHDATCSFNRIGFWFWKIFEQICQTQRSGELWVELRTAYKNFIRLSMCNQRLGQILTCQSFSIQQNYSRQGQFLQGHMVNFMRFMEHNLNLKFSDHPKSLRVSVP